MKTFSEFMQKHIGDCAVFLYLNSRISPTQKQSQLTFSTSSFYHQTALNNPYLKKMTGYSGLNMTYNNP